MSKMITRFGIDGLIFANNRSCKVYSVMQMDLMQVLSGRFHIPSVMIEVDHADVRKYNENNVFLHMEALLERIEAQRKGTVAAVPTAEGGRAVFQKK
jgi:benzoyl-CoA reductase/2-hydroxyglutaryl-CoA dehydratase subunit BcrC/BadD/HgdB